MSLQRRLAWTRLTDQGPICLMSLQFKRLHCSQCLKSQDTPENSSSPWQFAPSVLYLKYELEVIFNQSFLQIRATFSFSSFCLQFFWERMSTFLQVLFYFFFFAWFKFRLLIYEFVFSCNSNNTTVPCSKITSGKMSKEWLWCQITSTISTFQKKFAGILP